MKKTKNEKTKKDQNGGKKGNFVKKGTVDNGGCEDHRDCVNYQKNDEHDRINAGFDLVAQDGNSNSDY